MADYCTIDQVKAALADSFPTSDTSYDTLLTAICTRASREFDGETKRPSSYWYKASSDLETRYFTGSGTDKLWVDHIAASESSDVTVEMSLSGGVQTSDYTAIPSSDFFLWPDGDIPARRLDFDTLNGAYSHWYKYRRSVKVTTVFAYSTVLPDDVNQAAIILAARMFKRGQHGFQDAAAIPELSQIKYVKGLDPEADRIITNRGRRITV